jgi:hypothetical protein
MNYDSAKNSADGYELALKAWREAWIRKRIIPPDTPEEHQWAVEGMKHKRDFHTVKHARHQHR